MLKNYFAYFEGGRSLQRWVKRCFLLSRGHAPISPSNETPPKKSSHSPKRQSEYYSTLGQCDTIDSTIALYHSQNGLTLCLTALPEHAWRLLRRTLLNSTSSTWRGLPPHRANNQHRLACIGAYAEKITSSPSKMLS